jgi:uncharacterized protein (DUF1684 family)
MKTISRRGLVVGLLAILTLPALVIIAHADDTHLQSVEEWHAGRMELLGQSEGYLSLVGLYKLEPGRNTFGSNDSNDIILPDKAPAKCGVFIFQGDEVRINVDPAAGIMHGDTTVSAVTSEMVMIDDQNDVTRFLMGSYVFYHIERAGEHYVRLKDTESPALQKMGTIDRFPVDDAWSIEAVFETYDQPLPIVVPNILGYDSETNCTGAIVFEIDGKTYRLEPISAGEDWMFVVFGDATSARETYGGGRFVYTDAPDENGRVVIDFNRAYNPPCAFNDYATCPLPHATNILPVRITAGEKNYEPIH